MKQEAFYQYILYMLIVFAVCATSPSMSFSDESSDTGQSETAAQEAIPQDTGDAAAGDLDINVKLTTQNALDSTSVLSGSHVIRLDILTQTGAAVIDYPVSVPPGRNGLTPKVRLQYNSSKKNGIIGAGWDLNTDTVRRSAKNGVDYTGTDFIHNHKELVPVSVDGEGHGTYRQEKEQDFSLIEYKTDGSWSVTRKDGTQYHYGTDASSRQTGSQRTFKWFLKSVADTNGNTIEYTYQSGQGQTYPKSIKYADYYTVRFYYERRNDICVSYLSCSEVKTKSRLKTIAVKTDENNVRAYDLTYGYSGSSGRSVLTEITMFGSDYELDSDNRISGGTCFPSSKIAYNIDKVNFTLSESKDIKRSNKKRHLLSGDWNGDGRQDIADFSWSSSVTFYCSDEKTFIMKTSLSDLAQQTYYRYTKYGKDYDFPIVAGDWNGDGRTDIGRVVHDGVKFYVSGRDADGDLTFVYGTTMDDFGQNSYDSSHEYPVLAGDWNGDGRTDICRVVHDGVKFYVSGRDADGDLTFVHGTTMDDFGRSSYDNSNDYPVLAGDWNGDGRTDIGRVGRNGVKFYVSGNDAKGKLTFVNGMAMDDFGKNSYGKNILNTVLAGDWNGDGKTDIGRLNRHWNHRNHRYSVWYTTYLSSGTGFVFEQKVEVNDMLGPFCRERKDWKGRVTGYVPYKGNLFTGDWNGDGKTDIGRNLVIQDQGVSLAVSREQGGFKAYKNIFGIDRKIVTGDFSGVGKTGFAGFGGASKNNKNERLKIFLPDKQPCDLVSRFESSSGSVADINYIPSSQYQNTNLPLVIQTVSEITADDGLGNKSAASFSYAGGLYNYGEKELRSFEYTEKTNSDGTKEITQFHQDKFRDGLPVKTEHQSSDGTLLSIKEYTWKSTPYDDEKSAFVKMTNKKEIIYANTNKQDSVTVESDAAYEYSDSHGSITSKTVSGTGLSEDIVTEYEYDHFGSGGTYPLRKTKEVLSNSENNIAGHTEFTYETGTGNLQSVKRINTSGDDPEISYSYDTYGNVTKMTDAVGNVAEYEYDAAINTHIVKTARPVTGDYSHITERTMDLRYGVPSTSRNENGNTASYTYDPFGRTAQISYPDGGREETEYDDTAMPRCVIKSIKENNDSWIKTAGFLDGFERTVQTVLSSADMNGESNYAVSLFTFDSMGREKCTKGPFFNSDGRFMSDHFSEICSNPADMENGIVSTWSKNTYDDFGRTLCTERSGDISTSFSYRGTDITETDPDGCQTTRTADILGRVIKITEDPFGNDHKTAYAYSAAGDLLEISRINSATNNEIKNTFVFNTLGQKTSEKDPDTGNRTYQYDLNGNLVSRTDARNVTIRFDYDALNRMVKKRYPDQSSAQYIFDAGTNGIGLLDKKSNDNAVTRYARYDTMGRVLSEERTTGSKTVKFDCTWDITGRQTQKKVTENGTVFKTLQYKFYPGTNLLKTVQSESKDTITDICRITQYTPAGKMVTLTNQNNTETNHLYDDATGRLTALSASEGGEDQKNIMDRHYEYSKAGDITQIEDRVADITRKYEYDALHRLVSEKTNNTTTSSYTYDSFGRITEIGDIDLSYPVSQAGGSFR